MSKLSKELALIIANLNIHVDFERDLMIIHDLISKICEENEWDYNDFIYLSLQTKSGNMYTDMLKFLVLEEKLYLTRCYGAILVIKEMLGLK